MGIRKTRWTRPPNSLLGFYLTRFRPRLRHTSWWYREAAEYGGNGWVGLGTARGDRVQRSGYRRAVFVGGWNLSAGAGRGLRMGGPSLESLFIRRQLHGGRLPGLKICTVRGTKLGSTGQMDLDSNGADRLLGGVLDRTHEGVGLGVEHQKQARSSPSCIPGVFAANVHTRFLSLAPSLFTVRMLTVLAVLTTLSMLATFSVFTRSFDAHVLFGSLGTLS